MPRKLQKRPASTAAQKPAKGKLTAQDRKTLGQLTTLADGVVRAANARRDPHIDVPSRTLSNVRYSPRKRIIEMGTNKNRRQLFNLHQAKSYMQTMLVASGCKTLVDQGKTTSIRGLYYLLKHTIEGTREETFDEQTKASEALSESINTIGMAFLLAALAAVGEEIAFRGALQPVFGFWPTAVLFALTHLQYTLTPASLIIFGVAIAFGWIRQRYNTTTAMLTHFLYNFIPLALTVAAPEEAMQFITWLF